ncbi:MAG: hypothetical protein SPF89_11125 [Sphaerochaetaceae bacterium]|nr:hypothetical protein [Spirochaetales bacterium]MDY5500647.1 hypothetical protein [Sphaerochaetaceae bacterium]
MNKKEIVPATRPWKYEESVEVAKGLVGTAFRCTLDLVRELYAAREALSQPGCRTDIPQKDISKNSSNLVQFATGYTKPIQLHTFQNYLHDIGLSRRTAYYWLSLYSPREDKLYSPEELKQKVLALFQEVRERRKDEYAWEPDGWTPALEAKYRRWLEQTELGEKVTDELAADGDNISREWLLQEQSRIDADMTVEEIEHFDQLYRHYSPRIPKQIKPQGPLHAVLLIEDAAAKQYPKAPKEYLRLVAGILSDLARED